MECNIYTTVQHTGVSQKKVRSCVSDILKQLGTSGAISVHFIGDTRMARLNRIHRGKQGTTDVLSFAAQEGGGVFPGDEIGDIFISVPQIKRQAKVWNVSHKEELFRMLIHGVLHVLGYDHITKKQAKKMFSLQEAFLKKILS